MTLVLKRQLKTKEHLEKEKYLALSQCKKQQVHNGHFWLLLLSFFDSRKFNIPSASQLHIFQFCSQFCCFRSPYSSHVLKSTLDSTFLTSHMTGHLLRGLWGIWGHLWMCFSVAHVLGQAFSSCYSWDRVAPVTWQIGLHVFDLCLKRLRLKLNRLSGHHCCSLTSCIGLYYVVNWVWNES